MTIKLKATLEFLPKKNSVANCQLLLRPDQEPCKRVKQRPRVSVALASFLFAFKIWSVSTTEFSETLYFYMREVVLHRL